MLDFGFYNMDCMDGMKEFPDKYFDLAIVDPPYGINYDVKAMKAAGQQYGVAAAKKKTYHTSNWDSKIPPKEYFDELFRVSKNQIIWGGNYFTEYLSPSRAFICWDKRLEGLQRSFADCEYAWLNNELGVARMFRYVWDGMIQENMKNKEYRIHPTQKPIALYEWILNQYAKKGDIILDTHVGSASSLIACHNTNHKYVGFELDETYYKLAKQRLDQETAQMNIFDYLG
jgi:site-specific DNA-methyltransferase (adenine-specific)